MTTNEKYEMKIVPQNTMCISCEDEEATVYCGICGKPLCAFCRSFSPHDNKDCDN
jgi:hypothetical protein